MFVKKVDEADEELTEMVTLFLYLVFAQTVEGQ